MTCTNERRPQPLLSLAFRRAAGRITAVLWRDGIGREIAVPVPAKLQAELDALVAAADGEPEELTTL